MEKIEKDNNVWYDNMLEKFTRFYKYCLLPEIVRGNSKRGERCQDPEYIKGAQAEREKKKLSTKFRT